MKARTSLALALLALTSAACSADSGTRSSDPPPLPTTIAAPVVPPPSKPPSAPAPAVVAESDWQDARRRFGYIRSIDMDATPPTISFDAAQFLSGEAANEAAVEDGATPAGEPVPNDYYIRNPEPALETLPVAPGVRVTAVRCPTSCREGVVGEFEALAASFEQSETRWPTTTVAPRRSTGSRSRTAAL
jgi:hypothetical protein